jgi:hypothetical protein
MIVAMSRPANLRDVLTKAAFTFPEGSDITSLIYEINHHQVQAKQNPR